MVMPRSRSSSMLSRTWLVISRSVKRAGGLDQPVGQGGFPMVDMGDDGEVADMVDGRVGHGYAWQRRAEWPAGCGVQIGQTRPDVSYGAGEQVAQHDAGRLKRDRTAVADDAGRDLARPWSRRSLWITMRSSARTISNDAARAGGSSQTSLTPASNAWVLRDRTSTMISGSSHLRSSCREFSGRNAACASGSYSVRSSIRTAMPSGIDRSNRGLVAPSPRRNVERISPLTRRGSSARAP